MKLFYLNDRDIPIIIRIQHPAGMGDAIKDEFKSLGAAEGTVISYNIPAGCVPFIKTWDNVVMFSWMQEKTVDILYAPKQ